MEGRCFQPTRVDAGSYATLHDISCGISISKIHKAFSLCKLLFKK